MKSWQSSMASRDESASSSSAAAVSDGGDPGFLEILSAQQQLFRQTEGVLNALVDKKPAEDGLVCFEPSTISSLKELFSNLKDFFLLFQNRAIDEINGLGTALKDSKARELEWKELAELFTQYRNKVSNEMVSMKNVIESYGGIKEELQAQLREKELEVARLQDELALQADLLLRVQAVAMRRANLLAIERGIAEEEAAIAKSIAQLQVGPQ